MKLSSLVKGFPGRSLHPPLTDATIGTYTAATLFAVLGALGVSEENMSAGRSVFVHGMRVLNLVDEPAARAVTHGHPDKKTAKGA